MTDTVLILGAGFSKPAGIPLLGGFVDRMWELAIRGKAEKPLDSEDIKIFSDAMAIRDELDGYHGRAMFDDRNIEDILSILSFNVMAGGKKERDKLTAMAHAIARTIELSCTVKHPGIEPRKGRVIADGPDLYRDFWKALFKSLADGRKLPSIITFNYDLVLERSLLQTVVGTHFGVSNRLPFERLRLRYDYSQIPTIQYRVQYASYDTWSSSERSMSEGTLLEIEPLNETQAAAEIEILKLHGSLNFPRHRTAINPKAPSPAHNIAAAQTDPFIQPPVFNKTTDGRGSTMWATALERLRGAKNVVIVGYSLPQTDIYMQYFLKAAVGPNRNLNRITVFDPVMFTQSDAKVSMQHRYESCFSPQLRNRIEFLPRAVADRIPNGTTESFVASLTNNPGTLLF